MNSTPANQLRLTQPNKAVRIGERKAVRVKRAQDVIEVPAGVDPTAYVATDNGDGTFDVDLLSSKINAAGTADEPIVFTTSDELEAETQSDIDGDGLIAEVPLDGHDTIPHYLDATVKTPEDWAKVKADRETPEVSLSSSLMKTPWRRCRAVGRRQQAIRPAVPP